MYRAADDLRGNSELAGSALRYVLDDQPGFTRRPWRTGFPLLYGSGETDPRSGHQFAHSSFANSAGLDRRLGLHIREGHLQATGRDQRGRKQYLYHEQWVARRSALKYERLLDFAASLPRIRRRVARDLVRPGLPKEKVLAVVLRLMESTLIRIGNEHYVRENQSYGLTTLRDQHAHIHGAHVELRFRGKSGKWCECGVHDARLARIVRRCQELPGQHLLQFVDHEGKTHDVTSVDVNECLRSITGRDFSARIFAPGPPRPWHSPFCANPAKRVP